MCGSEFRTEMDAALNRAGVTPLLAPGLLFCNSPFSVGSDMCALTIRDIQYIATFRTNGSSAKRHEISSILLNIETHCASALLTYLGVP